MDQVGLNMEEKYNLFQIVAAVLHLGNIAFEENTADRKGTYMCTFIITISMCAIGIHNFVFLFLFIRIS